MKLLLESGGHILNQFKQLQIYTEAVEMWLKSESRLVSFLIPITVTVLLNDYKNCCRTDSEAIQTINSTVIQN